ncbi:MAG: alcohol dehydrogenase catalytic domain-containing protein [Eubacteriales bacterium]|nr:alcohol dehydrogenase catalytic domain-containing protein [Eubacteriales bacterium]
MKQATMQAAVFIGNGILELQEVEIPKITAPNDVLLRVEAAGICGSDLHILHVPQGQRGDPGTIMGHEFVAIVEQTGEAVTSVQIGDRVTVEPNIPCGICPECRSGHTNLCRSASNIGQWRNGGFAEYCVVPETQVHAISKSIPARRAALAEPVACVMNGMMRLNPQPYETVVLFGSGPIGLIFLRLLKLYGVRNVAVCEMIESRRMEAQKLGADLVLDSSRAGWQQTLIEQWGVGPDIVIDAVGAGPVLEQAIDVVQFGGRILIFGQNLTQQSTIRPGDINRKELTVLSALAVHHSFPPAISILENPDSGLEQIITHELPLREINKGIEWMRSRQAGKVIIYPGK